MKVYLDHNIVSAKVMLDMDEVETAAIVAMWRMVEQGHVTLAASKVGEGEAKAFGGPERQDLEEEYRRLESVPYLEDHVLLGFSHFTDHIGTWITTPHVEDEPTARRLRDLGLDQTDAHHVMEAVENGCDYFVTLDKRTILRHRAVIEAAFTSIKLCTPAQFIAEVAPL